MDAKLLQEKKLQADEQEKVSIRKEADVRQAIDKRILKARIEKQRVANERADKVRAYYGRQKQHQNRYVQYQSLSKNRNINANKDFETI